jgi:hypothetical protein
MSARRGRSVRTSSVKTGGGSIPSSGMGMSLFVGVVMSLLSEGNPSDWILVRGLWRSAVAGWWLWVFVVVEMGVDVDDVEVEGGVCAT